MKLGVYVYSCYLLLIECSLYLDKVNFLSVLTNLGVTSALFNICMPTTCFWALFIWKIFSHTFTLSLCLSLPVRCISYRQKQLGFVFVTKPVSFDWRIETINIQSYFWKVCSSSFYCFVSFLFFPNPHLLIYLCIEIYSFSYFYGCSSSPSVCRIPLSIFCSSGLMVMDCFSFVYHDKFLFFNYEGYLRWIVF
jgi:hypothetical protein